MYLFSFSIRLYVTFLKNGPSSFWTAARDKSIHSLFQASIFLIFVPKLTRCAYINEHNCILFSCLLTERETRDLHREWKTSRDRDPDAFLQNYAGICYLVRGALFCSKVPFSQKERVRDRSKDWWVASFVCLYAWKGRYLRKKQF